MKTKLRQFILEVMYEVVDDVNNYPPDDWEDDLLLTIKRKLQELEEK